MRSTTSDAIDRRSTARVPSSSAHRARPKRGSSSPPRCEASAITTPTSRKPGSWSSDFPDSSWADEALNNLATHYILVDDDATAAEVFGQYLDRFPRGRYAPRAAWKLGWWRYPPERQRRRDRGLRARRRDASRDPTIGRRGCIGRRGVRAPERTRSGGGPLHAGRDRLPALVLRPAGRRAAAASRRSVRRSARRCCERADRRRRASRRRRPPDARRPTQAPAQRRRPCDCRRPPRASVSWSPRGSTAPPPTKCATPSATVGSVAGARCDAGLADPGAGRLSRRHQRDEARLSAVPVRGRRPDAGRGAARDLPARLLGSDPQARGGARPRSVSGGRARRAGIELRSRRAIAGERVRADADRAVDRQASRAIAGHPPLLDAAR